MKNYIHLKEKCSIDICYKALQLGFSLPCVSLLICNLLHVLFPIFTSFTVMVLLMPLNLNNKETRKLLF